MGIPHARRRRAAADLEGFAHSAAAEGMSAAGGEARRAGQVGQAGRARQPGQEGQTGKAGMAGKQAGQARQERREPDMTRKHCEYKHVSAECSPLCTGVRSADGFDMTRK